MLNTNNGKIKSIDKILNSRNMVVISSLIRYIRFRLIIFLFIWGITGWSQGLVDLELDLSVLNQYTIGETTTVVFQVSISNCCDRWDIHECVISFEPKLLFTIPKGLELETDGSAILPNSGSFANRFEYDTGIYTIPGMTYCGTHLSNLKLTLYAKLLDINDANLMVEVYENSSYTYDLITDVDSEPNNGVDTDGDGNISDDPDDEDDGDGIDFSGPLDMEPNPPCTCTEDSGSESDSIIADSLAALSGIGITNPSPGGTAPPLPPAPMGPGTGSGPGLDATAGCMIAADVPSPIAANPEGTEGMFRFDYYMESLARFSFIDDGIRKTQDLHVNYYVNSNDGSMFFSTETGGFFGANAFATANRMGEIHGVVWKADGQRVIYGLERITGTLRALIVAQDQTAADVAGQKFLNVTDFVNSMGSMSRSPDPLPSHLVSKWGDVPGYIGQMNDVDGTKSTVTIYMGRSPDIAPIPTNSPLVGFLVGIFKDHIQANCNKLAVYTRMTYDDSGDYIELELQEIRPATFEFDGSPYKRTEWGAIPGSTAGNQMQVYNAQMESLSIREEAARTARRNCPPNDIACHDRYTAEIENLRREQDAIECQMACEMGMENLYDDCSCR